MKTKFFIILAFVAFNLSAQPKIVFDKSQHDFGRVNEGDGAASHDFTFKNTGTAPLVIQDVKTTCGCTTPEWTKQPIRPGATGFIKVSYDVKGRPGAIDKEITVYNNTTTSPIKLRIVGEVVAVDRHPSEAFRYTAGTIRMDDMHVAFNRVYSYEKPTLTVTAYNPGPNEAAISFVNLPAHIHVEATPVSIRKGEKAAIKVTYDAARKNEWGFVSDRISMILNGNHAKDYKLTVTATIEEDFSRWSAAQLQNAPALSIARPSIDFGVIRKGEKKTATVTISNTGKSKLLIRRVESTSTLITIDAPKEISASSSADIVVTYDSAGQSGEQSKAITIITNDPKNAQVVIRMKADVRE